MHIYSIKDPLITHARELSTSKGRIQHHQCLLEGLDHIWWALQAHVKISAVFVHDKIDQDHSLLSKLQKLEIPYYFVSDGILKKVTDTAYLIPFVGVAHKAPHTVSSSEFAIILDNLVDHGNIGTIIRSAAAFNIHDIRSTNQSTDLFFPKTIDASRGSVFSASFINYDSPAETIKQLKQSGYQIVATSPHAPQLQSLAPITNKPLALVLGNETNGCDELFMHNADITVQMPMSSNVESLNVAVAAGISIYELKLKLVITMLIQKIHKNLGRQLGVTSQLIRSALDHELAKVSPFSAIQIILLMILKCDVSMTLDQVTQDTGQHGAGLDLFLQPLIDAQFITRKEHNTIQLTIAGEELIGKLWPIIDQTEQKIVADFSATEMDLLHNFIERIQTNCYKITNS